MEEKQMPMSAFMAAAGALLSKYSNNLLREDAHSALNCKLLGDERKTDKIVQTIITFIDSFDENEYFVRGLYRTNGSLISQQNALGLIENAPGTPLKLYFIYELSAEDKASCIKTLLRKMPDTLFPQCQRAALLDISDTASQLEQSGESDSVFKALQLLVYFIPEVHKRCLESLLHHLVTVVAHSEKNLMDVSNLSLLFCSYIFPVTKDHRSMEEAKEEIERFGRLFPLLLRQPDELFHISLELLQTLDASRMKHMIDQNLSDVTGGPGSSSSHFSSPYVNPSTGRVETCVWSPINEDETAALMRTPQQQQKRTKKDNNKTHQQHGRAANASSTQQMTPTTTTVLVELSRLNTPVKNNDSLDDPEVVMVQSCSQRVRTPRRSTTDMEMAKLQAEIASMTDGPTRKKLLKKIQSEQRQKLGIRKGGVVGKAQLLKRAFTPMK